MAESAIPIESSSPNRRKKDKNIFKKILRRSNKNDPSSPSSQSSSLSSPKSSRRLKISSSPAGGSGGSRKGRGKRSGRFSSKKKTGTDNSIKVTSNNTSAITASTSISSTATTTTATPDPIVIPEDSVLQPRRVIKAVRPIPTQPYDPTTPPTSSYASDNGSVNAIKSTISPSEYETLETNSTSSAGERIQLRGGSNSILPSVQDENLREKTEQWRKERLDSTVAMRKENKEKDVMEHRRSNSHKDIKEIFDDGDKVQKVEGENGAEESSHNIVPNEIEVSEIFKTMTFHPEHKRKVNDEHDHTEKKLKMDETTTEDVTTSSVISTSTDDKESKDLLKVSVEMPAWLAPVTIVAATAVCAFAVVMMKSIRVRR